ncbi:hypothetical protein WR25_20004 isoform A [Diploscapter pachys]|uniref:SUN domain-containing protein n=2 Tax=Diploscapter pachys TaxID=2018661 RepID=A0A2A2LDV2_9BILA|nr:hypothetical protein WR25_20004 isoform A [Diploscapter pachys]
MKHRQKYRHPSLLVLSLRLLLLQVAVNFPVSSCRATGLNLSFPPYNFPALIRGEFPANEDLAREIERSQNVCHKVLPPINPSTFAPPLGRCDGTTTPTPLQAEISAQSNDTLSASGNDTGADFNETEKKQPVIATFDEWTKQKLNKKEQLNKQPTNSNAIPSSQTATQPGQPHVNLPPPAAAHSRNYASKECGAKILASNPEAENTKAVLNDKEMDEYMRIPCEKAPNKFLIVELCETIQPQKIELANLELFSSGPKEVRVFASERYPATEWVLAAELQVADSRQLQSFTIQKSPYAKFIKLDFLSHFGNEHYCTLSLLKVLGMSMVDEYELEAQSTLTEVAPPSSDGMAASSSAFPAATQQLVDSTPGQTGTIESPFQQPVDVEKKEEIAKVEPEQDTKVTEKKSSTNEKNLSGSAAEVIGKVVNGELLNELVNKVKNLVVDPRKSKQAKNQTAKRNSSYRTRISVCTKCTREQLQPRKSNFFCHAFFADNVANFSTSRNPRYDSRNLLSNFWRRRNEFIRKNYQSLRRKKTLQKEKESKSAKAQRETEESQKSDVKEKVNVKISEQQREEKKDFPDVQKNIEDQAKVQEIPPSVSDSSTQPASGTSQNQKPPAASEPVPEQLQQMAQNHQNGNQQNQQQQQQAVLPATSLSHKESVFMKLNKRIATLEMNMSLSSEYLSELSRQYVEQTEQQNKALQEAKIAAEKLIKEAVERVEQDAEKKISSLKSDVEALSEWMKSQQKKSAELTIWKRHSQKDFTCSAAASAMQTQAEMISRFVHAVDEKLEQMWTTEQVLFLIVVIQLGMYSLQKTMHWIYEKRQQNEAEEKEVDQKQKKFEEKLLKKVDRILREAKRDMHQIRRQRRKDIYRFGCSRLARLQNGRRKYLQIRKQA